VFSIDGASVSLTSELSDFSTLKSPKGYLKGLSEKKSSGHSEVTFYLGVRMTMFKSDIFPWSFCLFLNSSDMSYSLCKSVVYVHCGNRYILIKDF